MTSVASIALWCALDGGAAVAAEPVVVPEAAAPANAAAVERPSDARVQRRAARWPPRARRYLTRPLLPSAHHLDHGVIGVAAAGGWPHLYRLELALGLFDHLTLGVTAHWLPSQRVPGWSPVATLAFYRWSWMEIGVHYDQSMYPPPEDDDDPETPSFQQRAHWILGTLTFGQANVSGGVDAGVVRTIEIDPGSEPTEEGDNLSVVRWRFGGGLHLRAGTRRWGFSARFRGPTLYADFAFDLRFGAFELRPHGGWKPQGIVRATDRRWPTRR